MYTISITYAGDSTEVVNVDQYGIQDGCLWMYKRRSASAAANKRFIPLPRIKEWVVI